MTMTTTTATTTSATVRELDAAIRDLKKLREHIMLAEDLQWECPRAASEPEDTGIRSKGTPPNDPTGDTAIHLERMKLRAAMKRTKTHVHALGQAAWRMELDLRQPLKAYDPSPDSF